QGEFRLTRHWLAPTASSLSQGKGLLLLFIALELILAKRMGEVKRAAQKDEDEGTVQLSR
ncbi:MAG TPA: hypothetical protein DHW84_04200, partial [Firmicutes bacterium]|nr:hypothetical protein [Bacillota bacterium]